LFCSFGIYTCISLWWMMVARWIYHYLFIQCLSPLTLWVRMCGIL
jgi:hypothetical protein